MSDAEAKQQDPRSEMLKVMLLQLQEWINSVPESVDAVRTSTILHHQTAVGVWLTQLEQFGMMVGDREDAIAHITRLAETVQQIGERLNDEIDIRIPPRTQTFQAKSPGVTGTGDEEQHQAEEPQSNPPAVV